MIRIIVALLVIVYSGEITAQQWQGRVVGVSDNSGDLLDSIKVFSWPQTTPACLLDKLNFKLFAKTRLHNNRIDLRYMTKLKHHTEMTVEEREFWKGNFAVYKSATADLSKAQLYKYGVGIGQIKFPVHDDGHYLALITWGGEKQIIHNNGDGRMIYCKVMDGIVFLHDSMICEN